MNAIAAWLVSFGATFAAAAIGSCASIRAKDFYAELVKPSWAPPAGVFGPVWTLLYLMMAIAGGIAMTSGGGFALGLGVIFVIQLGLNALWSWTFFRWKSGFASLLTIAFLWMAIVVTMVSFWGVSPAAGALLMPYLAWVTFASGLNWAVCTLNRRLMRA